MFENAAVMRRDLTREPNLKKNQGFTLIEVVVVMAIIAVLAALIIGAITVARNTAEETIHRSNAHAIQVALEAMYAKTRSYDPSITYIGNGNLFVIALRLSSYQNELVTLQNTACTNLVTRGGGRVTFSTTPGAPAYTIVVEDAACSNVLNGDTIQGPLN